MLRRIFVAALMSAVGLGTSVGPLALGMFERIGDGPRLRVEITGSSGFRGSGTGARIMVGSQLTRHETFVRGY